MERVKLLPSICVSLAAMFLAGCGDSRSTAEKAAEQGILIVGNNQEPLSLDPHKATAVADGKIIATLLEGLVRPDAQDETRIHPGMAERWERSDDAREWIFYLRKACWSDGKPVTAHDFEYAYKRLLHPEFGGKYAEMLYPLKNAEAFNRGQCDWNEVGVKALDEHTLKLRLSGPTPHLLHLLLHFTWCPVPAHAVEAHGGMLDRRSLWSRVGNWVGNGAYVLDSHHFNDYLFVAVNPRYWRASEVRNRGIRFLPIVNGYTETRMFMDGKLHITNNVPPELLKVACSSRPDAYCQDPYYCTIFYRLNTTRPPLDDVRVRRALSLAVDRESLVNDVARGAGRAASCFTPPGAGYDSSFAYAHRSAQVEFARQLLAEAGYPDGFTTTLYISDKEIDTKLATVLQAQLKDIGITVDIQVIEWGTYLQKTAEGLPLFIMGWTTVTADADNGLYANFHSSAWGSQGNRSFYKNEKVDELLDGGRAEFDQEKRKAMYQEACQIIYDDAGWDFLAAELYNLGLRENVQGFVPMSTTFFDLSTVYFE